MVSLVSLVLFIIILILIPSQNQREDSQSWQNQTEGEQAGEIIVEDISTPEIEKYEVRISFYCNCERCNGKWYTPEAIGAGGIKLIEGIHCAASADIPMGATVEIEGLGSYIVADRVAEWVYEKHGTTIDIFMGTDHEKAWNMGTMRKDVKVYEN